MCVKCNKKLLMLYYVLPILQMITLMARYPCRLHQEQELPLGAKGDSYLDSKWYYSENCMLNL